MTDLGRIELDLSRMTLSQQLLLARILCGKGLLAALLDALFRAVLWLQRVADARDPYSIRCPVCGFWMWRMISCEAARCLLCGATWDAMDYYEGRRRVWLKTASA